MGTDARVHARRDGARLVHQGLDVHDFSLAAARAVRSALPFDGFCMLTFDPATLPQTLLRDSGRDFTPGKGGVEFVGALSHRLGEGLRRALLLTAVVSGPIRRSPVSS